MKKEIITKKSLWYLITSKIEARMNAWWLYEEKRETPPLQDFAKMCAELLPGDVLLFEGQSRISRVISIVTQSQWTHAALYIGRASELTKETEITALVKANFDGDPNEQLVVESLLGEGLVINTLAEYAHESIRLCRPRGILKEDVFHVVRYVLMQVGKEYDIRQLLDMARFLFPYAILPRRWLSSLFNYKAGGAARTVCSTVIAEAFMHVQFPVVPVLRAVEENISVARLNPKLITPRDFDYSPYFDVIKFPNVNYEKSFMGVRRRGGYKELPWEHNESVYCNSMNECFISDKDDADKSLKGEARS